VIISIRSNFRTDNFSRSWSVSKLAVRPFPMAVSGRNPEFEWAPLSLYGHHSTCMKDSQVSSVGYGCWVEKVKKMGFSGIRTRHLWQHGQKMAHRSNKNTKQTLGWLGRREILTWYRVLIVFFHMYIWDKFPKSKVSYNEFPKKKWRHFWV
jgi:hypothetical protein